MKAERLRLEVEVEIVAEALASFGGKTRRVGLGGTEQSELHSNSKPRNIGERQLAAGNVHAAQFGAAVQLWEHLVGVEQALLVEGAFDALLRVQVDFREHHRHQIALLDADAVLAGQDAADLDAKFQDVGAELLGALELALLVGVVEDERMQVAV